MHIASRFTRTLQADRSARWLLGSDHELVRALRRSGLTVERSLVVTGLMCMSATAWLEGLAGALAVLVAAAAVQVALGCELALTVQRCRECARDLVIDGRGDLPIEAVQREWRRLEGGACREGLAAWVDAVRDVAAHPAWWPGAVRPLFRPSVVAAVDSDLAELAARLRRESVGVRGVAMLERLLTQGTSPLYGNDVRGLREELRRTRFFISG
jgi:hypothetical protein